MTSYGTRAATYLALGPFNLARVAAYRLALRAGIHPAQRLKADQPAGPFFAQRSSPPPPSAVARGSWRDEGIWFGIHRFKCAPSPHWHSNPFTGKQSDTDRAWWDIPDFAPEVGDIKAIWEVSRFDWAIAMAQRGALGDTAALDRLNGWLEDWLDKNPPYRGANWKCGQETSIRVMHLALAAMLLDQVDGALPSLTALIRVHLARIAPTISYAIAQQNNHGTSEAAALFIGGSWLARRGLQDGKNWAQLGRQWLEERGLALIARDGSFSQYSLVYHRLMLDTYALTESWRRRCRLPAFSAELYERLGAATRWLQQLTDPETGDGPNLGANDGAWLMVLADTDYRDFRPSLQWAAALFLGRRAVPQAGPWDQPMIWLNSPAPAAGLDKPQSVTLDDGGLHVLRQEGCAAYLRYPRFRFRPSQADALHLDLWVDSENWLRDAGSYSYNSSVEDRTYFQGTASHNTVQFDNRDQMPRLGRFLFGAWLQSREVSPVHYVEEGIKAAAGYRDWYGAEHRREILLRSRMLLCIDRLSGKAERAVLRWRLKPGDWELSKRTLTNGHFTISIDSDDPDTRLTLTRGWESRYYLQKTSLPVLEVSVRVPATIHSRIEF